MRGAARLQAIRTIVMEGAGTNGAMGGSVTPDTPPNTFKVEGYRRTLDLANSRMRLEQVRTAQFPFALATVARMDQRLDGDVAFNVVAGGEGGEPQPRRIADAAAQQRRREFFEHPVTAVRAALEMREAFSPLRETWKKLGHELGLGIGIADGYATIGAIGFSGRSQYAAIGAVSNLAARLCSEARHDEILATRRVLTAVESRVEFESAGERTIRGFSKPVQVERVTGLRET